MPAIQKLNQCNYCGAKLKKTYNIFTILFLRDGQLIQCDNCKKWLALNVNPTVSLIHDFLIIPCLAILSMFAFWSAKWGNWPSAFAYSGVLFVVLYLRAFLYLFSSYGEVGGEIPKRKKDLTGSE